MEKLLTDRSMEKQMKLELWIKSSGGLLNVTNRNAICYGAGNACIEICNEMQLPNIQCVIDRDKHGQKIQLCNQTFEIQSPQVLKELSADQSYIVISSTRYADDIMEDICTCVGDVFPVCVGKENILYVYTSVEDMLLCDPFVQRKIVEQHVSLYINDYIREFKRIVSNCLEQAETEYFVPIKKGSKIIFIFGNDKKQWVFSFPGIFSLGEEQRRYWGGEINDIENIEKRYAIKKKYRLEESLTIYEDNRGYLLQHYAGEAVDCLDKEIRASIMVKCRQLHQSGAGIKIERSPIERYKELISVRNTIGRAVSDTERKLDDKMKLYIQYLDNPDISPKICHGDLHHGNMVSYEGKIFFIDWEFLCMMDPMYDVCRFLYYASFDEFDTNLELYDKKIRRMYKELPDDLKAYYGRTCSSEEYKHAFAMMLLCENIELLLSAVKKRKDTEKMAGLILKNMERYDGMEERV